MGRRWGERAGHPAVRVPARVSGRHCGGRRPSPAALETQTLSCGPWDGRLWAEPLAPPATGDQKLAVGETGPGPGSGEDQGAVGRASYPPSSPVLAHSGQSGGQEAMMADGHGALLDSGGTY